MTKKKFTPFQKPGGGTLSVTEHKWAESLVSNIGKHGIAPLTQYIQVPNGRQIVIPNKSAKGHSKQIQMYVLAEEGVRRMINYLIGLAWNGREDMEK